MKKPRKLKKKLNSPQPAEVLAISTARNNAELVAQCAQLGYITGHVLDPTYGYGKFWTVWQPETFTASDLNPDKSPYGNGTPVDFTEMPWDEEVFDTVVLDPPYKLNGTSTGEGPSAADERYGVDTYMPIDDRHQLIYDGIDECLQVLKTGGYLLVKCQDQVASGRVHWQTVMFTAHAEFAGCRLVDMLHLVGGRKQPAGRRQVHARRNYSTMLVLKKEAHVKCVRKGRETIGGVHQ